MLDLRQTPGSASFVHTYLNLVSRALLYIRLEYGMKHEAGCQIAKPHNSVGRMAVIYLLIDGPVWDGQAVLLWPQQIST